MSGRRIIVHSLAEACAALEAASEVGVPVTLASAIGAGGYAGPLWFKAVLEEAQSRFPAADVAAVLDCADEAGTALGALRHGLKRVRFTGNPEAARRLTEIAEALGAEIETGPAPEALDLLDQADGKALCQRYLKGESADESAPNLSRRR